MAVFRRAGRRATEESSDAESSACPRSAVRVRRHGDRPRPLSPSRPGVAACSTRRPPAPPRSRRMRRLPSRPWASTGRPPPDFWSGGLPGGCPGDCPRRAISTARTPSFSGRRPSPSVAAAEPVELPAPPDAGRVRSRLARASRASSLQDAEDYRYSRFREDLNSNENRECTFPATSRSISCR